LSLFLILIGGKFSLNSGGSGGIGAESSYTELERRHLQQQQQQQLSVEIGHRGLHSVSGSGSAPVPHIPGEVH